VGILNKYKVNNKIKYCRAADDDQSTGIAETNYAKLKVKVIFSEHRTFLPEYHSNLWEKRSNQ
jgi:hypothetical protein